jgi:hypothetical protein
MTISYRLLLLSPIPVFDQDGVFYAFDLWTRELAKQVEVAKLCLVCPVKGQDKGQQITEQIDQRVRVQSYELLDEISLDAFVSESDVVQIPGGSGWRGSRPARRFLKAARRAGKLVVLGVSSNRARTSWLNSSGRGLARRVKGFIDYIDIRLSQSYLALRADGVIVVGNGVAQLFTYLNPNIHVGTAAWITKSDIVAFLPSDMPQPLRICMASRIEVMKGMHIGISAIDTLVKTHRTDLRLTIIGEGPAKLDLERQVGTANLSATTSFLGQVAYPHPFLDLLGSMDILLLTNLNDEQPRVLFDAIARGCLPICPKTPTYRHFGLDARLFYERGNANDLCRTIWVLSDVKTRIAIQRDLIAIASLFTIDAMYEKRDLWIKSLLSSQYPLQQDRLSGATGSRL